VWRERAGVERNERHGQDRPEIRGGEVERVHAHVGRAGAARERDK
jgi:hypothetical protein